MATNSAAWIVVNLRSTESPRVYTTTKSRRNTPDLLELKKFDPVVRRHVAHRETR